MGRKNLYIADEHEPLIDRLEKALERRGQSLSDFFMQSVKNAVAPPAQGRSQGKSKIGIPNGSCAITVDAGWRHSGAVNAIIGPPDKPTARAHGSSLIFAKVLNSDDPFGLWIELNSEQKRYPHLPVLQFVIPWRFVLGLSVDPEDVSSDATRPEKRYGFAPDVDFTSTLAQELDAGAAVAMQSANSPKQKGEK